MRQGFVVAILFVLLAMPCAQSKIFMVAVGINRYEQRFMSPLTMACADARRMADFVGDSPNAQVSLLLDQRATRSNILSELRRVAAKAKADDVLMFYFSGHGLPGGIAVYDTRNPSTVLNYSDISAIFRRCPARRRFIFADTCHAGSGRLARKKNDSTADLRNSDVLLFLAARDKEIAREVPGIGGLFTTFLLQGLDGQADANRDRKISAREIFDYVSKGVRMQTRDGQHPVMWGSFDPKITIATY